MISHFNGATLFQAWKRKTPRGRRKGQTNFNGATLFQAWKLVIGSMSQSAKLQLQWGHTFSSVETFLNADGTTPQGYGLQWGHTFSSVETPINARGHEARPEASMGPHFFKRGNRWASPHSARPTWGASMGPHFFKRGNCLTARYTPYVICRFNGATLFQAWKPDATPLE